MLKRYQILLNEWQADHYKMIAQQYDVSFSEMIRMALCVDIMKATKAVFPDYKFNIEDKLIVDLMKKKEISGNVQIEEFHKFLSKLYFEIRKATELWKKEYFEREKKLAETAKKGLKKGLGE